MKRGNLLLLNAFLLAAALCLGVSVGPMLARAQSQDQEKKTEEKARKVWTNDDFPDRPPPPPAEKKEEKKKEAKKEPATDAWPWPEIDQLRQERAVVERELEVAHQKLNERVEEARDAFDDPARREVLEQAMAATEEAIAAKEARLKEIDATIADLEKQTKGKKRPAPKEAPKPKPESATPPPTS